MTLRMPIWIRTSTANSSLPSNNPRPLSRTYMVTTTSAARRCPWAKPSLLSLALAVNSSSSPQSRLVMARAWSKSGISARMRSWLFLHTTASILSFSTRSSSILICSVSIPPRSTRCASTLTAVKTAPSSSYILLRTCVSAARALSRIMCRRVGALVSFMRMAVWMTESSGSRACRYRHCSARPVSQTWSYLSILVWSKRLSDCTSACPILILWGGM